MSSEGKGVTCHIWVFRSMMTRRQIRQNGFRLDIRNIFSKTVI